MKPLDSVNASWLIGIRARLGDVITGDGHRIEVPHLVVDEELLHVAHHAQRELGRENAGVLRLVFFEDVGLHRAAHQRHRLGPQLRVFFRREHARRDQLIARESQQRDARAIVAFGKPPL